jgi:hypothetical protein
MACSAHQGEKDRCVCDFGKDAPLRRKLDLID